MNTRDEDKKIINTIHERDLSVFLERYGIKKEFDGKQIKCKFCDKIIDENNLYSLFRESGSMKFICDDPECVTKMLYYLEDKKREVISK